MMKNEQQLKEYAQKSIDENVETHYVEGVKQMLMKKTKLEFELEKVKKRIETWTLKEASDDYTAYNSVEGGRIR